MSSFRQIGELCRDVIAEAELAARASKSRSNWNEAGSGEATASMQPTTGGMSELDGGPTKGGERQPALPVEGRPGKPNGKGRGTVKATASVRGSVEQPGGTAVRSYGQRMKPALRIVSSRCLETAPNAAANGRCPRPAVSRHLVLVAGRHLT